jgi:hypothetical protein
MPPDFTVHFLTDPESDQPEPYRTLHICNYHAAEMLRTHADKIDEP